MERGKEYEVLISPAVRQDNNLPNTMETLTGRGILKPSSSRYWPGKDNVKEHRKNIFRKK